jgi:hypothetical protein
MEPAVAGGRTEARRTMTNVWTMLGAAMLVVATTSAQTADQRTVTGEVVDLDCRLTKGEGGRGDAHAACAMTCARKGNQLAILTADAVYLVEGDYTANRNAKLLDFVARSVEAKGTVSERDGAMRINVASMAVAK